MAKRSGLFLTLTGKAQRTCACHIVDGPHSADVRVAQSFLRSSAIQPHRDFQVHQNPSWMRDNRLLSSAAQYVQSCG